MRARTALFVLVSLAVFGVLGGLVYGKQTLLATGRTVYLRQVPVDMRSFMQGDYLRLRYAMERAVHEDPAWPTVSGGRLVLRADRRGVGRFVRIHRGEPLAPGEFLLRFRRRKNRLRIGAESFLFQEGHAPQPADSVYSELKVGPDGECILVGLKPSL